MPNHVSINRRPRSNAIPSEVGEAAKYLNYLVADSDDSLVSREMPYFTAILSLIEVFRGN